MRVSDRDEMLLSIEELSLAAGISTVRLATLVRLGIVEPAAPDAQEFTAAAAARLRRVLRLRRHLGVNLAGAVVIVELVERLERVQHELARWRTTEPADL